jgi:glyceraldehyde 3-phosphate dehydrogenase
MKQKVAINGFGRIGRQILRINLEQDAFDVVAINDLNPPESLSHLLKYDSNYGTIQNEISHTDSAIIIDGKEYKVFNEKDPASLPWQDLGVDVVLECTGFFTDREGASKHLEAGAKKVVISAPGKDSDCTIVLGVNEQNYDHENHTIISNGSCTTNCLAPVAKVINDNFGIEKGLMTTIHAYTNDQKILDLPHKDLRRARAAALSMIPTSTGAAKALSLVLPELEGKLNGLAIRVPTPTVSVVDLTCLVGKNTTKEEVNAKLKEASQNAMLNILGYSEVPLVSVDYKGTLTPRSSTASQPK